MCIVYDAAELSRCLTGSHMYSPRWAREPSRCLTGSYVYSRRWARAPSRCLTGSYVNTLAMTAIHIAALRAAMRAFYTTVQRLHSPRK